MTRNHQIRSPDEHYYALPLLSDEAYLAFLPAWLTRAVSDPAGPVAGMLLSHFGAGRRAGLSDRQARTIVAVADFVAHNGAFNFDEVDRTTLAGADDTHYIEASMSVGKRVLAA